MKYRRKTEEIEAFKYDGDLKGKNGYYVPEFAVEAFENGVLYYDSTGENTPPCELFVKTLEGNLHCSVGDYIIFNRENELTSIFPIKANKFETAFEMVPDHQTDKHECKDYYSLLSFMECAGDQIELTYKSYQHALDAILAIHSAIKLHEMGFSAMCIRNRIHIVKTKELNEKHEEQIKSLKKECAILLQEISYAELGHTKCGSENVVAVYNKAINQFIKSSEAKLRDLNDQIALIYRRG